MKNEERLRRYLEIFRQWSRARAAPASGVTMLADLLADSLYKSLGGWGRL
jgi:hypothetical protein